MLGTGTDERDLVGGEDLGEAGVFGKEAIAGMDRVGAGDLAGGEDLRDVEIGVRAPAAARCRRSRRRAGHAWRRRRRWSGPRRWRCRAPCRRGGFGERSRRDWRSAPFRRAAGLNSFDDHQRLAIFDRLPVFDHDPGDRARPRGRDLVHRLHRLDDEEGLALTHFLADIDIGLAARLGGAIGRADHRREHAARDGRPARRRRRSRSPSGTAAAIGAGAAEA